MSKGNMSTREVRATVAKELKKRWRKGQVAALIALARIAENAKSDMHVKLKLFWEKKYLNHTAYDNMRLDKKTGTSGVPGKRTSSNVYSIKCQRRRVKYIDEWQGPAVQHHRTLCWLVIGLKEQLQLEFQLNFQLEYRTSAVELPSADSIVVRRTLSDLTDNPSGLQGVNEDPKQEEKRAAFWSTIKPAHLVNAKPCTEVITRVTGPEIGNLTTPIFLVQLILLKQRQDLPKGGVYHLGIIFGPVDLQDRLQEKIEFLLI
ncbi:hypothetical protein Tco_1148001 [Tanacetum coccineum]